MNMVDHKKNILLILGSTLGDPKSTKTYSGVPHNLFREFEKMGCLVGTVDTYEVRPLDLIKGRLDLRRSINTGRPKLNALWRYSETGMKTLSERLRKRQSTQPDHNVVFQIGVGGIPKNETKLVAHVEITVETAIKGKIFADSYGFSGHSDYEISEAIKWEKYFLEQCSLVWTNTEWTAEGLIKQGVDKKKIRIYPPACGMDDPGIIERNWSACNILFVARFWKIKGGEYLIEAFRELRKKIPSAKLSIVGCKPDIQDAGVTVYGPLSKNIKREAELLDKLYREATTYCMPTLWDSVGIVFMEAALYGLPVVMFKGQGREKIFPSTMAIHIENNDVNELAEELIKLCRSPEKMKQMGDKGRQLIIDEYSWDKLAMNLYKDISNLG